MILGVKFMRTFRENKIIFTPNAIKKIKIKNSLFSLEFHIDQTLPEVVITRDKIASVNALRLSEDWTFLF